MANETPFRCYSTQGPKLPFILTEYEPEPLERSHVQVLITHNGLCHTDIHMRDNDWKITAYPLVAGHEVVGVVETAGEDVKHLKKGDRVAFGWIRDSCRGCLHCIQGEENICLEGYKGLILGGNKGGFQQRMRAPADFAIKLPPTLASSDAAPLMCAGITVYQPLRTHWKRPGMKVGVIGIGGLGHLALQMARHMGGHVTAFSTSRNKEAEAKSFGAQEFVVYNPNAKPGEGYGVAPQNRVELLINCSPSLPPEADYRNMLSLLIANGTLVLTGIPPDSNIQVGLLDVIFGQKKLAGSIVGGRAAISEMFEFCGAHGIKPQTQIMKLSQLNEAIEVVEQNKARYRIVLESDF